MHCEEIGLLFGRKRLDGRERGSERVEVREGKTNGCKSRIESVDSETECKRGADGGEEWMEDREGKSEE